MLACGGGSDDAPGIFRDGPGTGEPGATTGGETTGGTTSGNPGTFGGEGTTGGTNPQSCAGTTVQAQKAAVDIIFVIDQSGSMSEEIVQIKTNINAFAQSIAASGLDYHVIMVAERATGPTDNDRFAICVPEPLGGAGCTDKAPQFVQVDQNVQSNNALSLLISTYPRWQSALRPEAMKVFIPITDDNSNLSAATFESQLLALQPAGMFGTTAARKYVFHSIIGVNTAVTTSTPATPISTAKCSQAVNTGQEYQKLSNLTGGIQESVCKASYQGVFDGIAKGISQKLACEILVPKAEGKPADPSKVIIQFTPTSGAAKELTRVTDATKCAGIADSWHYDDNNNPTKILLCPTTCTAVGNEKTAKLDVKLGCEAPAPR